MCVMHDIDASQYPSNGSEYVTFDPRFDHALDDKGSSNAEFNQLSMNIFTFVSVLFIAVLGGYGRKTETVRVTIPKAARKLRKNVVRRLRQSLRVRAAYFEAESDDDGEAGFEKYRVTVPY
ncbi:hypothetical protein AAVH_07105 [Aphelenchoides avenae]|nr:hypothetical protein AAVH_07105 [Aphelenchus avenae]